jgi:hypothetical protein
MTIRRIVGNSSPARHLSNREALGPNFSNKRHPSVKQGFSKVSVMVGAFDGHLIFLAKSVDIDNILCKLMLSVSTSTPS